MSEARSEKESPLHRGSGRRPALEISRRRMLCSTGAAAALWIGAFPAASAADENEARILKRGDRIKLDVKPDAIIQKAYDLGYKYEKAHGG